MSKSFVCLIALLTWMGSAKADEVVVSDITIQQGGEATLNIELNNTVEYTRFSLDLVLPPGISVVGQKLGNRFEGTDHRIRLGTWPKWYRFIGDTDESMSIPGNSGTLVEVTLKADNSIATGSYQATLTGYDQADGKEYGMEFTTTNDEAVLFSRVTFTINVSEPGQGVTTKKCATPTIAYEKSSLLFSCATEGAECKVTISDNDIKEYTGSKVALSPVYTIIVYAKADGYADSDVATATIQWRDGRPLFDGFSSVTIDGKAANDVNGDGKVDVADIATVISIMAANARLAGDMED